VAFTFTFPATARQPSPEEVAAWFTEQGEAFEAEGPHSLLLRGLPVRVIAVPGEALQAHVDVTTTTPLVRLVDLLFDLSNRAATDVRLAGVGKVDRLGLDTYADETRFFSYRRATHRGEPTYGRQFSLIGLPG